jgi:hypothetical protein
MPLVIPATAQTLEEVANDMYETNKRAVTYDEIEEWITTMSRNTVLPHTVTGRYRRIVTYTKQYQKFLFGEIFNKVNAHLRENGLPAPPDFRHPRKDYWHRRYLAAKKERQTPYNPSPEPKQLVLPPIRGAAKIVLSLKLTSDCLAETMLQSVFQRYFHENLGANVCNVMRVASFGNFWYDFLIEFSLPLFTVLDLLKHVAWVEEVKTLPEEAFGNKDLH